MAEQQGDSPGGWKSRPLGPAALGAIFAVLGALVLLAAGPTDTNNRFGVPSWWLGWGSIGIGLLLVLVASRRRSPD